MLNGTEVKVHIKFETLFIPPAVICASVFLYGYFSTVIFSVQIHIRPLRTNKRYLVDVWMF